MKLHLLKRKEDIVNHLKKEIKKERNNNKNENIISFLE